MSATDRTALGGLKDPKLRRGLVLPLGLLAAWQLVTELQLVNTHLLVRPDQVLAAAQRELGEGQLLSHLGHSIARDLGGALLGTVVGVLVGALMAMSRLGERLIGPSFHAAKQVAIFAWIPLMSVWLGTGELAKVVFIASAAFYPVVLNTYEGIRGVARHHVEVARVFRFSRWQVIRKVIWPSAAPSVFVGVHLALIYSWLATIGAEYLLGAAPGVGNLMIDGRETFRMDKVLLGVVIVGVVGFALSSLAAKLEARWVGSRARAA